MGWSPIRVCKNKYVDQNDLAATLAIKGSADATPKGESGNPLHVADKASKPGIHPGFEIQGQTSLQRYFKKAVRHSLSVMQNLRVAKLTFIGFKLKSDMAGKTVLKQNGLTAQLQRLLSLFCSRSIKMKGQLIAINIGNMMPQVSKLV